MSRYVYKILQGELHTLREFIRHEKIRIDVKKSHGLDVKDLQKQYNYFRKQIIAIKAAIATLKAARKNKQ
jgi:hypothetical protein